MRRNFLRIFILIFGMLLYGWCVAATTTIRLECVRGCSTPECAVAQKAMLHVALRRQTPMDFMYEIRAAIEACVDDRLTISSDVRKSLNEDLSRVNAEYIKELQIVITSVETFLNGLPVYASVPDDDPYKNNIINQLEWYKRLLYDYLESGPCEGLLARPTTS